MSLTSNGENGENAKKRRKKMDCDEKKVTELFPTSHTKKKGKDEAEFVYYCRTILSTLSTNGCLREEVRQ